MNRAHQLGERSHLKFQFTPEVFQFPPLHPSWSLVLPAITGMAPNSADFARQHSASFDSCTTKCQHIFFQEKIWNISSSQATALSSACMTMASHLISHLNTWVLLKIGGTSKPMGFLKNAQWITWMMLGPQKILRSSISLSPLGPQDPWRSRWCRSKSLHHWYFDRGAWLPLLAEPGCDRGLLGDL